MKEGHSRESALALREELEESASVQTTSTSNSGGINYGTENKSYQQQNRYHPWLGL